MKFKAFTLTDLLVALVIIGVIAALTLPNIISHLQYKGYVEKLKKTYSLIQNATSLIVYEEGEPSEWILNAYEMQSHEPNINVVNLYSKKLNYTSYCGYSFWKETECAGTTETYKDMNGQKLNLAMLVSAAYYNFLLKDGVTLGLRFRSNIGGFFLWNYPDLIFFVDVNGKNKPNTVGRDIFYFYLDKRDRGKIYPYGYNLEDDCKKGGAGYTCAYKILKENNMNY